jgi:amino acid adenylation domain-containing protein
VHTEESQLESAVSYPLSPQQEHMWLIGGEGAGFRAQCAVVLRGAHDAAAIERALGEVVARHEILRTTFRRQTGVKVPTQVVNDSLAPAWSAETRDDESVLTSVDELPALLRAEASQAFDLEHGPVLRALLVGLGSDVQLLVLTAPSVIADARSLVTVAGEVATLLTGDGELGEPLQYADYAAWRNEIAAEADDAGEAGRTFWSQLELHGAPPLLFAGSPDASAEFAPAGQRIPVAGDAVTSAAESAGVTPALFAEAAWHVAVARASGAERLTLAGAIDGRAHEELIGAVGAFAQSVPVTTQYADATTFAEILDQVRRERSAAEQQQDYEPTALMGALADGAIAFVDASFSPETAVAVAERHDRFGLQLSLVDAGGQLELAYDANVYTSEDAARLAALVASVVEGAAADVNLQVAQIGLTDDATRQLVVREWNDTQADVTESCIHQLFEQNAERLATADAVWASGKKLTYAELNNRANQVAHRLRELGVGRNTAVGLCLGRSTNMIVSLLGILKAGGAYVPLNFEHPAARLAHQLTEAGAPVLLTQEDLVDRMPEFGGVTVCLDRDAETIDAQPTTNPDNVNEPDDLVYVMYTSGSTGLPKGVAVTHRNLANYTAHMLRKFAAADAGEPLQYAAASAISTDLGNTSVFPALAGGGTLHLIGHEASMDGSVFAQYVAEHPIDVLKITPSQIGGLIATADIRSILPRRWLVTGGEALSWELARQVLEAGSCPLLNHYGPTETTVGSCTYDVDAIDEQRAGTVPIGRPIANTRAYVVDGQLQPLPVGIAGELCIGGVGVAKGYVGQEELTAAAFVSDPFADADGARMYRTGDRVRFLPDGNVEFLGRIDEQVKIRGYRVEPGEVDRTLLRHPAVTRAAVVPREDAHGDLRLVAYLVASPAPSAVELQAFLAETLPDYMIPSAFVLLDDLPLTASGKIDRKSLPDPATVEAPATDYVEPRTPLEQALAEMWAEVLGVERVGATDDFFALGGHSLLATQVIARIRSEYADIPLHSIFTSPTVESLAEVVLAAELDTLEAENGDGAA